MRIPQARSVRVSTPVLAGDLQPSVCGISSPVETSIWFEDYLGSRPPIRVSYGDTANTRLFPDGSTSLSLAGSTPILTMITQYTLTCQQCTGGACEGMIYFNYKDSISRGIDITASSPLTLLQSALEDLTDLTNLFITDSLTYEITSSTSSTSICSSSGISTFEISILSSFGNLPLISLLDSTLVSTILDVPLNLTLQSNHGTGTLAECSNQGLCNHQTGLCSCLENWVGGTIAYRALSSDGSATSDGVGSRGDCGYLEISTEICSSIGTSSSSAHCNGHGYCVTINEPCLCDENWYGYNCQYATCPMGHAWFAEAISTYEAHQQLTECSSMGKCDRLTGLCHCRHGYSGASCQYLDCIYDTSTGSTCAGNGWCVSTREYIYHTSGHSYGIEGYSRNYPDTWDATMINTCLCSAPTMSNGHPLYPPVTSNGIISGKPVETRNLPGYGGYNCQSRLCPFGPKVTTGRVLSGDFEVQRILCIGSSSTSSSFTLIFKDIWVSQVITGDMSQQEIKEAIEWIPALGNISVEFRNEENDNLTTACNTAPNATHGGFYLTFLDDLGAAGTFPLLTTEASGVTIERVTEGNIVSLLSLLSSP
jgi:hypothetical protein